jgi:hypothetical protein
MLKLWAVRKLLQIQSSTHLFQAQVSPQYDAQRQASVPIWEKPALAIGMENIQARQYPL